MDYKYGLRSINEKDRWIYVSCDDDMVAEEPDAFFYLVNTIQKDVGGDVVSVGWYQYKISGDKLELVYQWDGVFGITIFYPPDVTKEQVVAFLSKYMCL